MITFIFTNTNEEGISRRIKGTKRHLLAQESEIRNITNVLAQTTHFTIDEIRELIRNHRTLERGGEMDREKFRDVMSNAFDLKHSLMLNRLFYTFDLDDDNHVDVFEWISGLSVFLRGTHDEQIKFVYNVYDINGDRSLAREELFMCLEGSLHKTKDYGEEDLDEVLQELIELGMKLLDRDNDGLITFNDFREAVISDPTLIQSIGPCLPPMQASRTFLKALACDPVKITAEYDEKWAKTAYAISPKSTEEEEVTTSRLFETPIRKSTFAFHHK